MHMYIHVLVSQQYNVTHSSKNKVQACISVCSVSMIVTVIFFSVEWIKSGYQQQYLEPYEWPPTDQEMEGISPVQGTLIIIFIAFMITFYA